MTLYILHNLLN